MAELCNSRTSIELAVGWNVMNADGSKMKVLKQNAFTNPGFGFHFSISAAQITECGGSAAESKMNVKKKGPKKWLKNWFCGGKLSFLPTNTCPTITISRRMAVAWSRTGAEIETMQSQEQPSDGVLPFSDVTGLLAAAAGAEKQQALVARIFVPPPSDPATSTSVDRFASLTSLAKQLREYVQEQTTIDGQSYIWHRESPSISVVSPTLAKQASSSRHTSRHPPHILFHLRTGGECIEDEWFAAHLLINASAHFGQHGLCISIEDEDGQFLLIEAADCLPEWVTPETVLNRVWIFDGHLHLIPPHHKSSDDGALSVPRAVELVRDASTLTRASDDI